MESTASRFHHVPIQDIDLEDLTYSLIPWIEQPDKALRSSIRRFGILHPPVLRERNNKTFSIIAGRKRISIAGQLAPHNPLPCRVVPAELREKDVFSLLLEENLSCRPLSVVEQIVFLEKLLLISPMDEAIPMLERMGLKPRKHILNDMLKLRQLGEPALQALHTGTLAAKNARKLLKLSNDDQQLIIQFITDLHLGGSKQQKLIELCAELIMRNDSPLDEILGEFSPAQAQGQPENIPQQGTELLSWLHRQCFPLASSAEKSFKKQVARLELPEVMSLSHSAAFENEEITLSIRFPDLDALSRVIEKMKKLLENN